MKHVTSIRPIKHHYTTGEEPVLVDCSDQMTRVCKYPRSSAGAYKMACELIGSLFAEVWELGNPKISFVSVLSSHVPADMFPSFFARPCIGSEFIQGVVDITPTSFRGVSGTRDNLFMLMKIALFDFWIANEDRNANNANLMYDIINDRIVPIDFGCTFNTATFDYPLSQLTSTDTILAADIYSHLSKDISKIDLEILKEDLEAYYRYAVGKCRAMTEYVIDTIPAEWNIPVKVVRTKIDELHTEKWVSAVWLNFIECLTDNTSNE